MACKFLAGAIHTEKVLLLGMMEFDDCHAIALDDSGLDDGGACDKLVYM